MTSPRCHCIFLVLNFSKIDFNRLTLAHIVVTKFFVLNCSLDFILYRSKQWSSNNALSARSCCQSERSSSRKPQQANGRNLDRLEARGDLDPADVLSEMVSDKTLTKELRATAANYLLPYKYGKLGVIPVARFIPEQIEVPQFQTIQQAEDYLANIPVLLGKGEIDSQ